MLSVLASRSGGKNRLQDGLDLRLDHPGVALEECGQVVANDFATESVRALSRCAADHSGKQQPALGLVALRDGVVDLRGEQDDGRQVEVRVDRPKGDAVIECSGGVYYWVEVPSDD